MSIRSIVHYNNVNQKNGIYFGSVLDAIHDSDLGIVLVGLGKVTWPSPQRLARITKLFCWEEESSITDKWGV